MTEIECTPCGGTGRLASLQEHLEGKPGSSECFYCEGTGKVPYPSEASLTDEDKEWIAGEMRIERRIELRREQRERGK